MLLPFFVVLLIRVRYIYTQTRACKKTAKHTKTFWLRLLRQSGRCCYWHGFVSLGKFYTVMCMCKCTFEYLSLGLKLAKKESVLLPVKTENQKQRAEKNARESYSLEATRSRPIAHTYKTVHAYIRQIYVYMVVTVHNMW